MAKNSTFPCYLRVLRPHVKTPKYQKSPITRAVYISVSQPLECVPVPGLENLFTGLGTLEKLKIYQKLLRNQVFLRIKSFKTVLPGQLATKVFVTDIKDKKKSFYRDLDLKRLRTTSLYWSLKLRFPNDSIRTLFCSNVLYEMKKAWKRYFYTDFYFDLFTDRNAINVNFTFKTIRCNRCDNKIRIMSFWIKSKLIRSFKFYILKHF